MLLAYIALQHMLFPQEHPRLGEPVGDRIMAATTAFRDVAPRTFLASIASAFAFARAIVLDTMRLRAAMNKKYDINE